MLQRFRIRVLALFLLSVLVRLPALDRPVSKHHEFNTAFFLVPMEIWDSEGVMEHGAMPRYPYGPGRPGEGTARLSVSDYYVSFPSLSYLVPYGVFKLLHVPPSPLGLRLFNLVLHLVLCLLLFELLAKLFGAWPALVATAFHLLAPGTLWFHGNGYTHHVLGAFLYLGMLWALASVLGDARRRSAQLMLYTLALLSLFLTEWIAVFWVSTLLPLLFLYRKRLPHVRALMVCSVVAALLGTGLLVWQYGHFLGLEAYLGYQHERFTYRSAASDPAGLLEQGIAWVKWTLVAYGPWVLGIVLLGFRVLREQGRGALWNDPLRNTLLVLVLLPPALHHLVFGQFTWEHDYAVIIDAFAWAFLLAQILSLVRPSPRTTVLGTGVVALLGLGQYYAINRPGAFGQNGDPYSIYQDIGSTIQRTAARDETVFLTGFDDSVGRNNPQVVYYAKRAFVAVEDRAEAMAYLRERRLPKGRLYVLKDGRVSAVQELLP